MHYRTLRGYRGFARLRVEFRVSKSVKRALRRHCRKEKVSMSCLVAETMIAVKKLIDEEIQEAKRLDRKRLGKKVATSKRKVLRFPRSA